jgi:hypothetical protein
MTLASKLNKTLPDKKYYDGYAIEYQTPSRVGLKHIGTFEQYSDAKLLFDAIKNGSHSKYKKYKGMFLLYKIAYSKHEPENYFMDEVMEKYNETR